MAKGSRVRSASASVGLPDSGRLSINSDFKGDPEFVFPIVSQGHRRCNDFRSDGCDSFDVGIAYDPADASFQITNPYAAKRVLAHASYQLDFNPCLFEVASEGSIGDNRISTTRESVPVELHLPSRLGRVPVHAAGESGCSFADHLGGGGGQQPQSRGRNGTYGVSERHHRTGATPERGRGCPINAVRVYA